MKKYLKMFATAWSAGDKKKIIKSLSVIGIVCAIAAGVTISYFQDTETSTGNKFVAGKLNLKIDNTCHYNGMICTENKVWAEESTGSATEPDMVGTACECTWSAKDLTNELFFDYLDVKPGDNGEDTVSIHVDNNDAWICAEIANLKNFDNGCDSPENKIDNPTTSCGDPGEGQGELQDNLFFTIWKDTDCDNILEEGVVAGHCVNVGATGCDRPEMVNNQELCELMLPADCAWIPAQPAEQVLVDNQKATSLLWPIADSTTGGVPIKGGADYCLGIAWNVPIGTSNIIQTDSLEGDVVFNAVQSRNMPDFKCGDLYTEVCDDKDNTYNNQIDEGPLWLNKGQSCSVGVGACSATGTYICDTGNSAGVTVCSAVAGNPGEEICDGLDNDCDGSIDNGNPGGGGTCSTGQQGVCAAGINNCQGGSIQCVQNVQPTTEVCNGLDDDCDGQIDEGVKTTYYRDVDNDGYGNPSVTTQACAKPSGYAVNNQDCNDYNALVKPGATEICDNIDNDCDGLIDEGLVMRNYYKDQDNDGYAVNDYQNRCGPLGWYDIYPLGQIDCNDTNVNVHPNATEVCNGLDDDCWSGIDDRFPQQWTACRDCAFWDPWYQCVNGSLYCPPCN